MKYKIGIRKNAIIPLDAEVIASNGKWVKYYGEWFSSGMSLHKNYVIAFSRLRRPLKAAVAAKTSLNKRSAAPKAPPKSRKPRLRTA